MTYCGRREKTNFSKNPTWASTQRPDLESALATSKNDASAASSLTLGSDEKFDDDAKYHYHHHHHQRNCGVTFCTMLKKALLYCPITIDYQQINRRRRQKSRDGKIGVAVANDLPPPPPTTTTTAASKKLSAQHDEYFMHKFFRTYWSNFLCWRATKIFTFILLVAYVGYSLYHASRIIINITPDRVITDDSPMVRVFKNAERYVWPFSAIGHGYVLTPPDFRNASNRKMMIDFIRTFESTKYFTTKSSAGTTLWFKDYLSYLDFLEGSGDFGSLAEDYLPNFYSQLEPFLLTGDNSKFMSDIHFKSDQSLISGEPNIEKFQFRVFFSHVSTWNDHVELMLHWRRSCAKFPALSAMVADHSSLNPYLDQRLALGPTTLQTMGVALVSMTIVTAIFMPDVIGIFYITLSFISVDIGVIGFLRLWNCDLDPATLPGIVMTIGFSVYYTARVCYNYQCADKSLTVADKISLTMGAVGWPILQGGLGTVSGILPLAFVRTRISRTFFKTLVLVVCSGLLHGLLFMPVLLASLDSSNVVKQKKKKRKKFTDLETVVKKSAERQVFCESAA